MKFPIISILDVKYLSRNIIFLAYEEKFRFYGKAVNEFLSQYMNPDLSKEAPLFERCGVIRHAINLDFESEDFNAIQYSFGNFVQNY